MKTAERLIQGILVCIALVLAVQALLPVKVPPNVRKNTLAASEPKQGDTCLGTAIRVDYPYEPGVVAPWECHKQCEDVNIQYYVVFGDGKATQCELLPGCDDWGQDHDITCVPPADEASAS